MSDTASASRRVQIGHVVCDFDQLTVELNGATRRLEPRLAGVLSVLVQRAGGTLSRDELLALAWEDDASDEALTQAISRLRKLLGDRKAIETVPRIGYRLTAPVKPGPAPAIGEPSAASRAPAGLRDPDKVLSALRGRWVGRVVLLIAAATLGALLALWLFAASQTGEQEFEIQPAEDGDVEFIPQDGSQP